MIRTAAFLYALLVFRFVKDVFIFDKIIIHSNESMVYLITSLLPIHPTTQAKNTPNTHIVLLSQH